MPLLWFLPQVAKLLLHPSIFLLSVNRNRFTSLPFWSLYQVWAFGTQLLWLVIAFTTPHPKRPNWLEWIGVAFRVLITAEAVWLLLVALDPQDATRRHRRRAAWSLGIAMGAMAVLSRSLSSLGVIRIGCFSVIAGLILVWFLFDFPTVPFVRTHVGLMLAYHGSQMMGSLMGRGLKAWSPEWVLVDAWAAGLNAVALLGWVWLLRRGWRRAAQSATLIR